MKTLIFLLSALVLGGCSPTSQAQGPAYPAGEVINVAPIPEDDRPMHIGASVTYSMVTTTSGKFRVFGRSSVFFLKGNVAKVRSIGTYLGYRCGKALCITNPQMAPNCYCIN